MKTLLYKLALSAGLISGTALFAHAQTIGIAVDINANGVGIVGPSIVKIIGSPYIYSEWVKSIVKMEDGTVYKDLKLNYNQQDDRPIFIADNKALQYFAKPVKEFTLYNITNQNQETKTFRNGFPKLDNATTSSFYEVLSEGKINLIKHTSKKLVEERGAGSINVSKQITESSKYYIGKGEQYTKIKKNKKSVLDVLKDKEEILSTYISANSLNLSEDADLVKLCNYYNTL